MAKKVVDGIRIFLVTDEEITKMIKAINKTGLLEEDCVAGANLLGTAKKFVAAMESISPKDQKKIPPALMKYFDRIVQGEGEGEDPPEGNGEASAPAEQAGEAEEPEEPEASEPAAPAPRTKPSGKKAAPSKPAPAAKTTPSKAKPSAPAPAAKLKKPASAKKSEAGPSNKALVYKEWKKSKGSKTPAELHAFIEEKVTIGTIRSWTNQWKHGNNFPAGVTG